MTTDPLALLEDRKAERERILQRELERARREAKSLGRSLTCHTKPLELHYTCAGLAAATSPHGCLCECHDGELIAKATVRREVREHFAGEEAP